MGNVDDKDDFDIFSSVTMIGILYIYINVISCCLCDVFSSEVLNIVDVQRTLHPSPAK